MKKIGNLRVISLILLIFICLVSCGDLKPVYESDTASKLTEENGDTENSVFESAYVTDPPETEDTSAFNYGKVRYVKTENLIRHEDYPDEKIGSLVSGSDKGVVTIFETDFEDGDPKCGGKATARSDDGVGVVDGAMYIPYSESDPNHISGGWTTWAPDAAASVNEYKQVCLSSELVEHSYHPHAWTAGFIGCFVSNYTFTIPDQPGDGVWISFNANSKIVTVYAADRSSWNWPAGNVSLNVPEELITGDTKIDVVCTRDKEIYVYLKETLITKILCGSDTVTVYDGGGNEVYSGAFLASSVNGDHFSIFAHGGGGFAMDNIKIYGCTYESSIKETNVEAIPVGDNALGCDITDRNDVIGICYSMWFNAIHGDGDGKVENALNVAELTEKYGFSARYGFGTKEEQHNAINAFHYWSKPAQGYYRSTDKEAIRNNMTLLYNAGVDFIILDYTYATSPGYDIGTATWSSYIYKPSAALLDTIMEMRAEGLGTPYVVFWMGSENMFDQIYEKFYGVEKWQDCFVYWNGKPFILNWLYDKSLVNNEKFTVRSMYGLQGKVKKGQWSYLEVSNRRTVSYDSDKNPEHISVSVAAQETYMSLSTAHGRDGGRFWNTQWKNAFDARPKIITLTWWNEWCAQLYYVDGVGYIFTDNFNQEYSRDIEPMEGGHGDLYYRWMCEYIRAYRSGEECPSLIQK